MLLCDIDGGFDMNVVVSHTWLIDCVLNRYVVRTAHWTYLPWPYDFDLRKYQK